MTVLQTLEQLKNWDEYRIFMRKYLKLAGPESAPIFVSKRRIEFAIGGKPTRGHAILLGKRGRLLAQRMRQQGEPFLLGQVRSDGKRLAVSGLPDKQALGAARTLRRLKLGFELAQAEEGAGGADRAELVRKAGRIEKAVELWQKTEVLATRELRKLQRAIQATGDPRARGVVRGFERILRRLGRIDDEAREASAAAERGDLRGFIVARQDFVAKATGILEHVETDELIRDADANPAVAIDLRGTLSGSLKRLLAAV